MQIHFGVFFLTALLLLILPFDWIAALVIAASFHELCHVFALYVLNGKILNIKIRSTECIIETSRIGEWKQFISILAGPVGSISLMLLRHQVPKIAICGLFQGLYNLLPVLPLDGGRLLTLLTYRFCPQQAVKVMRLTAIGTCIVVDLLVIWLCFSDFSGIWLFLLAFSWNIRFLPRKIPCKPSEIGVQ